MANRMQQRRGTAARWADLNPVLAIGEIGFEIDTNAFKVGDGNTSWNNLPYFVNKNLLAPASPSPMMLMGA